MATNFIMLLALFHLKSWVSANNEMIVYEYTWHNFTAFTAFGWTEDVPGTTQAYEKPSSMDFILFALNDNVTDEVWGWRAADVGRNNLNYSLDLGSKHCGMVNATVSMKFYLEASLGGRNGTYIYPGCKTYTDSCKCYLDNSTRSTWSTKRQVVVLSDSKTFYISVNLAPSGLFLLEEVNLTYTIKRSMECPDPCNHDCDYRKIDCHNYYTCIGKLHKDFRTCDKNLGLAFNPKTKSCDLMGNVEGCPELSPPTRCGCGFRAHAENCSRYYYCPDTCDLERCEERECPNGLLWSMDANGDGSGKRQCVPPEKAVCFNGTSNSEMAPTSIRIVGEDVRREYVFHTFDDLISYGWTENPEGTTQTYSKPSEVEPRLYDLNDNFTGEVWGLRASEDDGNSLTYTLVLSEDKEYCGLGWENGMPEVTLKYYMLGNASLKVDTYDSLSSSSFGTWSIVTYEIWKRIVDIRISLNVTGLILFDEIRLMFNTRQGLNCPYACNHDCDYRGLDCHNYYACIGSRYKEFRKCDKNEGLAFNPATKSCDLMEKVQGCFKPNPTPPPPSYCICEFRPHGEDCSSYYYCPDTCNLQQCEERRCPGGLIWSMDAKGDGSGQRQCVTPNIASCNNETLSKL